MLGGRPGDLNLETPGFQAVRVEETGVHSHTPCPLAPLPFRRRPRCAQHSGRPLVGVAEGPRLQPVVLRTGDSGAQLAPRRPWISQPSNARGLSLVEGSWRQKGAEPSFPT